MIHRFIFTVLLFLAGPAARAQFPSLPLRIGGTVTVDGAPVALPTADEYEFIVSLQTTGAAVASTFGFTGAGAYAIDVPCFDAVLEPTGVPAGARLIVTARRNGQTLPVLQPVNGIVTAGAAGTLTIAHLALTTARSRLTNLSVLTDISAAVPTFTVGTVIGGAGVTGSKPLLVRAAGPSLTSLGVGGVLPDPKLDFYFGQTALATNDDWGGGAALASAFTQVGAFTYAAANSKDAAVLNSTLLPGGYSVVVGGKSGATGTAIAEIYDATPAAGYTPNTPRLINLSVLKQVAPGSTLTLGFTLGGIAPQAVLIRAIGPALGLAPFNIAGSLTDPQLTVYNSANAVVASNNDWAGTVALADAVRRTGAFAVASASSKDAMLLITLPPGGYTVQTSGVGGAGGFVIAEVYEIP